MDRITRRSLISYLGKASLAVPLVGLIACSSSPAASPTAAPASTSAAAAPTSASSAPTSAASTPAPQAAAAPAANGKTPVVIWYGTDYLQATTDTLASQLADFTKKTGIPAKLEVKSGSWGDQLNAAVQAGTAPDAWQSYDYQCQYWNAQGQAMEISQLINKYKNQQGGFFPYVEATIGNNGKTFAVPLAVNTWPFHARQDLLDKVNGGKWPDTWELQQTVGKTITSAPKLYAYGWTMGKTNDTNNHFIGTLWTFGGKLQNEDGTFGLKANDDAALAVLDLAKKMYSDLKIIPPAVVQWDDGGNNNAYQDEQVAWTSNPLSILGWLQQHKPDLAKITSLFNYPKGPAGSFGQVDVWGVTIWKNTKQPDAILGAAEWWIDPTHYADRIRTLAPRFTPMYQGLLDDKVWDNPIYQGVKDIAKTGRIMAYAASPQAGYSTFTTRFLIGEMMQNLLVKNLSSKDAYNQFYQAAKQIYSQY
jgi:ABC-type glycerol-3-phosphate transport system substrate-binding protein